MKFNHLEDHVLVSFNDTKVSFCLMTKKYEPDKLLPELYESQFEPDFWSDVNFELMLAKDGTFIELNGINSSRSHFDCFLHEAIDFTNDVKEFLKRAYEHGFSMIYTHGYSYFSRKDYKPKSLFFKDVTKDELI